MTSVAAERRRVRALIERAGVAMLMNVDEKGAHVGRPMLLLLVQNDPHIYFLTHQSSRKVTHLAVRPEVGLSIVSPNCLLVVAGSAQLSRDPELIRTFVEPDVSRLVSRRQGRSRSHRHSRGGRTDRLLGTAEQPSRPAPACRQGGPDPPGRRDSDEDSGWLVIRKWPKSTRDSLSCHCLLVRGVRCGDFAPQYQGVPGSPPSSEVVVR